MSRSRRLGPVLFLAGCTGGSATAASDGKPAPVQCTPVGDSGGCTIPRSTEPCSTGPAHVFGDFGRATATDGPYPTCTPRCGAEAEPTVNNIAAVPSGACATEGDICDTSLGIGCPDGNGGYTLGSLSALRCTCVSGHWTCAITSQGGGVCATQLVDGG